MEAIVDIPMNVNGGPKKQEQKKQRMLVGLLLDYAKNSTLHGLRYITDPGVSIIERTFWGITFTISAVLCFLFIRQIYHEKWVETPVIISLNEQMVSVGMVPFPSITICPEQKIISSRYNFTSEYEKYLGKNKSNYLRDTSITKFEDISVLCNSQAPGISNRNCSNTSTIDNILEVSPTLKEVFLTCRWRGTNWIDCQSIFTKVLTSEGVCYNFNSLAANEIFKYDSIQRDYSYLDSSKESKNWNEQQNYLNTDSGAYPWRGRKNVANAALQVVLKSSTIEPYDILCDGATRGYKIYLQHPTDFPQASLSYYAVSPNQVTSLALKLDMITTSNSLKDYLPNVRKCYFPGERSLQYFRIYTQKNCELECQSNFAFENCGCVWFFMPHNDSESICTGRRKSCIERALDELDELQLKAELNFEIPTCGCYPTCNSINYDAEIMKMDYNHQADKNSFLKRFRRIFMPQRDITNTTQFSKILVYFEKPRYVAMLRSELYSWIEILANFGGLLGLFLGFSFLSLVEIIYFATIRERHYKIDIYFKEPRFMSMIRSELYSSTELLANCGGLLGLFLGFSFLSLVEIAYFATIRLCCRLKSDLKADNKIADNRSD